MSAAYTIYITLCFVSGLALCKCK